MLCGLTLVVSCATVMVGGFRILFGGVPDVTGCGGADGTGGFHADFTLGDTSDPNHPLHDLLQDENAFAWLPIHCGFSAAPRTSWMRRSR